MGAQSCVVVMALLVIALAVIMNGTAFGAPRWVCGMNKNSSGGDELTTKGLWQVCRGEVCTMLDLSAQDTWFKAVQALFSIGTGLCAITTVAFCSIFAMNMSTERMYAIIWGVMLTNVISSLCLSTSIGLFGMRVARTEPGGDTLIERQLDWAFYVAIWGAIFSLSSSILLIWESCLACNWLQRRPYYDL